MATWEYELVPPPDDPRARELWLQYTAGFILCEDVRRYALDRLAPDLTDRERKAAEAAIDAALHGLTMVLDGVSGSLANATHRVELHTEVRLVRESDGVTQTALDLAHGDGMGAGFAGWRDGNFGAFPVMRRRT